MICDGCDGKGRWFSPMRGDIDCDRCEGTGEIVNTLEFEWKTRPADPKDADMETFSEWIDDFFEELEKYKSKRSCDFCSGTGIHFGFDDGICGWCKE